MLNEESGVSLIFFTYLWIYPIVGESAVITFVGGQVLRISFVRYLFLKIHVEVCVSIHKKKAFNYQLLDTDLRIVSTRTYLASQQERIQLIPTWCQKC